MVIFFARMSTEYMHMRFSEVTGNTLVPDFTQAVSLV